MVQSRLLVRTVNSLYEVLIKSRRFRRVEGHAAGNPPLAEWRSFHLVGPIVRGRPMRLWWSRGQSGRVVDLDVLTTAPVLDVTVSHRPADSESQSHVLDTGPEQRPRAATTVPPRAGEATGESGSLTD